MPKKEFRALERRRGGEKKPKSAPRFDFSYLFSAVVQIGVALCAVATVLYFAYHLINEFAEPVTTTPAVTVRQAAYTEANAYIIRDERPITSSHASGFIDMRVKEGERVGKGEILCDIYPAAEEQLRGEIALLDYEIALLETARENAASSGSIAAVGKEISKNYASVMDLIAEGRLADAGAISDSLRSSLSALAILSGEGGGISARLSALKEERAAAISRLGGSIATPRADAIGYFFSDCDGYEGVFNAELIENFNNERFAAAIASSPEPTSLCIGKMVSSSKWYVAVALSAKENRSYRVGNSYNIIFSDNAGRSISMKLEKSVYDENGHTIAERMFFVTPVPKGTDSISVSAKTERLRPCSKVEMQIKALPHTTLSFSAMDASTMTNGKEGNIRTWMLLSSELRGYIANPDYYFEADDSIHRMAADLLMMVQGWRKYQMPQNGVLQPVEDCLNIYGRLTPLKKKKTVKGVELCVKMYNKNGEVLEGETTTDSLGRYLFTLPDCNGEWNVLMYTSKDKKREKYRVKIDRHFSPTPRFIGYKELEMPPAGSPTMFVGDNHEDDSAFLIPLGKRTKVLPTVKVKAKRIYENARAAWETESKGKKLAQIYYNCDLETEKMADLGIASPDFLEWIKERNPLIDGSVTDMKSYTFESTFFTRSEDVTPEEITEYGEFRYHRTGFHEGGFTYNNRPAVTGRFFLYCNSEATPMRPRIG